MIHELRRKFVLINMICVVLILMAVFIAIFFNNSRQMYKESINTLQENIEIAHNKLPIQPDIDEETGEVLEASSFVIEFDYENIYIYNNNIPFDIDEIKAIVNKVVKADTKAGTPGELKRYNLRYITEYTSDGVIMSFIDLTNELRLKKSMFMISLVAGFVALAGFLCVSIILSRWALAPVERAWNQQKQFAADASHELKTPLTVILANMEILKSNKSDKIENQMDWVNNTEAEATRMKHLANNLLFLAKNSDMKKPQIMEKVNLSDLATNTSLAFEPVAFERKIAIDTFIQSDIFVGGDPGQIRQLISILLDNAVKYSYDDTTIKVYVKEIVNKPMLVVNNTGVPIAQNDLTNIFERFYRGDKSRSEEGYGLGLSIAKNIVYQHKAIISARCNETDGTTFTVTFPPYKA